MILMIVRDQNIVNHIREIRIREMFHIRMIPVITDQWINQYADISGLNQYTRVPEIPHPDLITHISVISWRGFCREQVAEKALLLCRNIKDFLYIRKSLGGPFHF